MHQDSSEKIHEILPQPDKTLKQPFFWSNVINQILNSTLIASLGTAFIGTFLVSYVTQKYQEAAQIREHRKIYLDLFYKESFDLNKARLEDEKKIISEAITAAAEVTNASDRLLGLLNKIWDKGTKEEKAKILIFFNEKKNYWSQKKFFFEQQIAYYHALPSFKEKSNNVENENSAVESAQVLKNWILFSENIDDYIDRSYRIYSNYQELKGSGEEEKATKLTNWALGVDCFKINEQYDDKSFFPCDNSFINIQRKKLLSSRENFFISVQLWQGNSWKWLSPPDKLLDDILKK